MSEVILQYLGKLLENAHCHFDRIVDAVRAIGDDQEFVERMREPVVPSAIDQIEAGHGHGLDPAACNVVVKGDRSHDRVPM